MENEELTIEKKIFIMVVVLCLEIQPSMEVTFLTQPPEEVNGDEGSSTILVCIVSDLNENENVTWKVNNRRISNGSHIINEEQKAKYTVTTLIDDIHQTNNLVVRNIQRRDGSNNYQCAVTRNDLEQTLVSRIVKIKVSEIPADQYPKCINQNTKKKFKEGDMLNIICISEKSHPKPTLSWHRDNTILRTIISLKIPDEIRITYNMTLTQNDNGAIYWCQLRIPDNLKFERNCSIGPIQVDYKPRVNLSTPKFIVGAEAIFVCFSLASPSTVTYNWTIPPLIQNYKIENNGQVLRLVNVQRDYEGMNIKCNVHNEIGFGSDETFIIIDDEDSIVQDSFLDQSHNMNNVNQEYPELPAATILSVAGASLLLLSLIMAVLLCYFQVYTRSHAIDYTGQRIPQPDVYFEPKDSLHSTFAGEATPWKRSVGVQVSGDSSESTYTYAEIEERMKQRLSA